MFAPNGRGEKSELISERAILTKNPDKCYMCLFFVVFLVILGVVVGTVVGVSG